MKIVDYSHIEASTPRRETSLKEAVTAALLFIIPALLLLVLAN
jgi:hypothetical protein